MSAPVQIQADVEGLSGEPAEGGEHEVVHENRHDLATHKAFQLGHLVVDEEGEVEQEQGQHQVDQDDCALTRFALPVEAEYQNFTKHYRVKAGFSKLSRCVDKYSSWSV